MISKHTSFITTLVCVALISPVIAYAQAPDISAVGAFITSVNKTIVATLATLFIALGVTAFFFGMAQFIFASRDADPKKMGEGKQFMLWSVISLFVMFSIYGIIIFGQNLIPGLNKTDITIPSFNFGGARPGANTGGLPSGGNTTPTNPSGSSPATSGCDGVPVNGNCRTAGGEAGTCRTGNGATDYRNVCVSNTASNTSGASSFTPLSDSDCRSRANEGKVCQSGGGGGVCFYDGGGNGYCNVPSRGGAGGGNYSNEGINAPCPAGQTKHNGVCYPDEI